VRACGAGDGRVSAASFSVLEVAKLTRIVDGRPRIIVDPPLLMPITDLLPKQIDQAAFEAQIKDLASGRITAERDM